MSLETEMFAKRLKSVLDSKGMLPIDLARDSGVSQPQISNYLSGGYKPSRKNLDKIASALNVGQAYLLGFEDDPKYSGPSAKKLQPSDEDIKVALFGGDDEVSDEEWEEVLSYVDYIREKRKKNKK